MCKPQIRGHLPPLFCVFRLFQQDGKPCVEEKQAEGPAQSAAVEHGCKKGGGKGAERAERDGRAQRAAVEIAVFSVGEERNTCRRQKVEQVDRLRRALFHAEKERHAQKEQRSAADAPGGEDACCKPAQRAQEPLRHRRYLHAP